MKVTLTVIEGPHKGKCFEFEQHDTFIVGRGRTATFKLSQEDKFFSRNHFLIEVNPPMCRIMDLNSSNGTFVNGKCVKSVDLLDRDLIRGGDTVMSVSIESAVAPLSSKADISEPAATIVPRGFGKQAGTVPSTTPYVEPPPSSEGVSHPTLTLPFFEAPDQPRPTPSPHPQFPGFRTVRVLGRGGMGIVYEADSLADRSRVAIKVISPNVSVAAGDLSRFIREASILRELVHPSIVRYRDMGQVEGSLFIVMDYIDGVTAERVVANNQGPLPVKRAVDLIAQLLTALSYAHLRGYVHRDVKPANLLITSRNGVETLLLADFGLARTYQSSKLSGLTMTGDIGGTTPYMPPEQITNFRKVAPAADQYSAAATLYYLLTGKLVYKFPREVSKQLLMVLQDEPIRIETRRSDLSPKLVDAIHKALSRQPSDRFPDSIEFMKALLAATD